MARAKAAARGAGKTARVAAPKAKPAGKVRRSASTSAVVSSEIDTKPRPRARKPAKAVAVKAKPAGKPRRPAAAVAVASSEVATKRDRTARKPVKAKAAAEPAAKRAAAAGSRKARREGPQRQGAETRRRGSRNVPARRGPVQELPPYLAAPAASAGGEEERIESSKYLARDIPPRVFEEERFLFPESYSKNRVRLLVKDPEWLFAHWDVSRKAWVALRADLGERALALSRLTLRVEDPSNGLLSVVLLPGGARSWYLRTHLEHSSYRAELGLTTPAGVFHRLATSNVVTTPRVGPSPVRARRLARFGNGAPEAQASAPSAGETPPRRGARKAPVALIDGTQPRESGLAERGGASDVFGPGAGVSRRGGASDVHRR